MMHDANIPHYLAKHDIMKNKILVWIKDCASWLVNPKSTSFNEITDFWINILAAKEGDLTEELKVYHRKHLFSVLNASLTYKQNLKEWFEFLVDNLCIIESLMKVQKYAADLDILVEFQQNCQDGKLNQFDLEKFSLIGKPHNQVTLSTRHSSKGLEFEVAVLLGIEEGNFPYYSTVKIPKELNEQRRIFFVCLTRAKKVCYLLRSKRITTNTRYGRKTWIKEPSMFWKELYNSLKHKKVVITQNT